MEEKIQGPPWWVIVLVAALVSTAFLGSRALFEPSETRYAECAREMMLSGNYLLPTLHHEDHLSKPPLAYWGIVAGMQLLGTNAWGARAYQAPLFVLTAVLVALLGERVWRSPRGRWAGLIYGTMLVPVAAAGVLTADTLLAFLETAAVSCFWLAWSERSSGRWGLFFWVFLGLGFAAKGPPALLPLLSIAAFLLLLRPKRLRRAGVLLSPIGIVLFFGISLGWYLLVMGAMSGAFEYFVRDELVARIFSARHHRNPGLIHVFRLYLPALTVGTLPWVFLFVPLLRKVFSRESWGRLRTSPAVLFLFLWFLLPLTVFCLSQSKLVLYVLPLFAPLALLLCRPLVSRSGAWISRRGAYALAICVMGLVGFRFAASRIDAPRDSRALAAFVDRLIASPRDELISVGRAIHGPDFLLGLRTENVNAEGPVALDSEQYRRAEDEIAELPGSRHRHIFLVDGKRLPWLEEKVAETGVRCSHVKAPVRFHALVCDPDPAIPSPLRVGVVLDHGEMAMSRRTLARKIRRAESTLPLDALVVIRRGAPVRPLAERILDPGGSDDYWPLTERGVSVLVLTDDDPLPSSPTRLGGGAIEFFVNEKGPGEWVLNFLSGSEHAELTRKGEGAEGIVLTIDGIPRANAGNGELVVLELSESGFSCPG